MAYASKRNRRPMEYASKSSHGYIINNPAVQYLLSQCDIPKKAEDIDITSNQTIPYYSIDINPIKYIIAIDGGYEEIPVQNAFPSATVCFFQFGALIFSVQDLETIEEKPFIDPSDIAKLKEIQRIPLTLPIRNVNLKTEKSLTDSIRRTIYNFFNQKREDDDRLIDTLRWFIFQEYKSQRDSWILSSCPDCSKTNIPLIREQMNKDHTFDCPVCGNNIYLTDVFRLHEAIDDELGAGGIIGYTITSFEQIVMVHVIRLILSIKPQLLNQVLFIKDGPLAFFGQTANMHRPMRELVTFLLEKHNLFLAGLEKSGGFVEHADEISAILKPGTFLILDNDYIYKYILPGRSDPSNPYGRSTYYSNKLIFKTPSGGMYVVSIPTTETLTHPQNSDFKNLHTILTNIDKLKCDMYDNALLPVALANKLVSLANVPSSRILQRFAIETMGR
jgi:hypothetical protein